jgi:hypothetical protein
MFCGSSPPGSPFGHRPGCSRCRRPAFCFAESRTGGTAASARRSPKNQHQESAMHAIKALAVATILVFGFTSLAFARSGGGGGGSGASGGGASGGSAGGTSGGASSSSGTGSGTSGSGVSTTGGNARTTGSGARSGPNYPVNPLNTLNSGDPNGPYRSYRPTNRLGIPSSPYGQ